jgi:hypothetical protein
VTPTLIGGCCAAMTVQEGHAWPSRGAERSVTVITNFARRLRYRYKTGTKLPKGVGDGCTVAVRA